MENDISTLFADLVIRSRLAQHYNVDEAYFNDLGDIYKHKDKLGQTARKQYDEMCELARQFNRERG